MHDADVKREQAKGALKSVVAEFDSFQRKRLIPLEDTIARLQQGNKLPDIPSMNNDFQAYRRAYLLTLLCGDSLGQCINDVCADIDVFRVNLALYVQLRLKSLEAYRENEGRYDARTHLAVKEAEQNLIRQAKDTAALYAELNATLTAEMVDIELDIAGGSSLSA